MQNNFLIIHVRASTKKKHSSGQDVPRDIFFAKERRVFVRPNFGNFYTIRVINKSGPAPQESRMPLNQFVLHNMHFNEKKITAHNFFKSHVVIFFAMFKSKC